MRSDDGVRALRGAEHGLLDEFAIDVRLSEHGVNRTHDALVDIARGGVLHRGDNLQVIVDQNGVGVGAADINAKFVHISSTFFQLQFFLPSGRPRSRAELKTRSSYRSLHSLCVAPRILSIRKRSLRNAKFCSPRLGCEAGPHSALG